MVGLPNKPMGFPTKNDQPLGCEMGVSLYHIHHLKGYAMDMYLCLKGRHRVKPSLTTSLWRHAKFQGLETREADVTNQQFKQGACK